MTFLLVKVAWERCKATLVNKTSVFERKGLETNIQQCHRHFCVSGFPATTLTQIHLFDVLISGTSYICFLLPPLLVSAVDV